MCVCVFVCKCVCVCVCLNSLFPVWIVLVAFRLWAIANWTEPFIQFKAFVPLTQSESDYTGHSTSFKHITSIIVREKNGTNIALPPSLLPSLLPSPSLSIPIKLYTTNSRKNPEESQRIRNIGGNSTRVSHLISSPSSWAIESIRSNGFGIAGTHCSNSLDFFNPSNCSYTVRYNYTMRYRMYNHSVSLTVCSWIFSKKIQNKNASTTQRFSFIYNFRAVWLNLNRWNNRYDNTHSGTNHNSHYNSN